MPTEVASQAHMGRQGTGIPPAIILKSRVGPAPPKDLGDEDKGCHRLAGDRQQANLLSHMQPLVPHRIKVPDYEVEGREWEWS